MQADRFKADELIALNPSPAALQRLRQWGARVVETSVQAGLGLRVVRLQLPPGIDARTALAVANERDPGVFDLHHLYQLAQADAAAVRRRELRADAAHGLARAKRQLRA